MPEEITLKDKMSLYEGGQTQAVQFAVLREWRGIRGCKNPCGI
jgi:hypothetical protein